LSNVYEAFDFSASGFIQLLIRNAHRPRAGSNALMRRNIQLRMGQQLPDEFKNRHSAIAWAQIAGLRNRIVHDLRESI
jgi:hypothetical protein